MLNAVDPLFNVPIFDACFEAGVTYLDMAMTLSEPHPEHPYERWGQARRLPVRASGAWAEGPARPRRDRRSSRAPQTSSPATRPITCSREIDEIGVRDGANLVVEGYDFAPTFSIWTTIEECLNPPVIWEKERGWYTTEPFSEPEVFDFPEGIGPVECVNVEHEEVLLVPRWVDCNRVTFKYGLGDEFIDVLKTLHKLGLDSKEKDPRQGRRGRAARRRRGSTTRPGDAGRTDEREDLRGDARHRPRQGRRAAATYLYHVVDNEWSMREYGSQAVVWQTAINPVDRTRAPADGTLDRRRRARPGGVRRRAVPRSAPVSTARRTACSSCSLVSDPLA